MKAGGREDLVAMPKTNRPEYMRFRRRLRAAREQAGLTQAIAAKQLRKPQSFVAKCEAGERRVDVVELEGFARLYRKPLAFFLDERRSDG